MEGVGIPQYREPPYGNQSTMGSDYPADHYRPSWLSRDCTVGMLLLFVSVAIIIVALVASHVG